MIIAQWLYSRKGSFYLANNEFVHYMDGIKMIRQVGNDYAIRTKTMYRSDSTNFLLEFIT